MKRKLLFLLIIATGLFIFNACGTSEYKIKFIVDGGVYSTFSTNGNEMVKMPDDPVKDGFAFDGWFSDKDVWKNPFTADSLSNVPLYSDINVYCKWTEDDPSANAGIVSAEGFSFEENNGFITVPNSTETFSFADKITVSENASYVISQDPDGTKTIPTQTVSLQTGNNKIYLIVTLNGGKKKNVYVMTVRRRPIYTVIFNTSGGNAVENQRIEEGYLATEPTTERLGYFFTGWDYDFNKPITDRTTISAGWQARADTPYKVEYYLENLEDDEYTLTETVNLTGTTDLQVTVEIKEYEHYTYDRTEFQNGGTHNHYYDGGVYTSYNVNGDGSSVMKVFYKLEKYYINIQTSDKNISLSQTFNGYYKYGHAIPSIVVRDKNLGYEFSGWFSDDELVTKETVLNSFTVDRIVNYVANSSVKEEMANFVFTSTDTTCKITGIKDNAVTKIQIPDYVTDIEDSAFSDCNDLQYNEDDNGFYLGNDNNRFLYFVGPKSTAVSSYIVNDNVKIISGGAFYGCSSLRNIVLPYFSKYPLGYIFGNESYTGATEITQYAKFDSANESAMRFYIPTALESVTITKGVIPYGAFSNCSNLTDIIISDNVAKIGAKAFSGCENLKYNLYENAYYLGNDENEFLCLIKPINDSITTCKINENMKFLYGSFDGCADLQFNEYENCYYLGNETNPYIILVKAVSETVTNCVINDNAKIICSDAFLNCYNITDIAIPDNVTSIGISAFSGCGGIESITVSAGNEKYKSENDCIIEKETNTLILGCKTSVIPDDITSIGAYAFSGCGSLLILTIPDNVTSIGDHAFFGCGRIKSVTISESVTGIGESAFSGCDRLINISFNGTKAQWQAIIKGENWKKNVPATVVHCTDGDLSI